MILFTGAQMLRESLVKVLGDRIDDEFETRIRNLIIMEEGVLNVNNLVLHNYGENRYVGSVDIEVDENMRAADITKLSRKLIRHAKSEGLTLTSIGISGTNISNPEALKIWNSGQEELTERAYGTKDKCFKCNYNVLRTAILCCRTSVKGGDKEE